MISFKYNVLKSETLTILSGKVLAIYSSEKYFIEPDKYPLIENILESGMMLNVQSGCPYRLTALEDSKIIEVGNSRCSTVIRLEDDYGRANKDDTDK